MIYSKARIKNILTRMSRRQSLRSYFWLMSWLLIKLMASSIKLEVICVTTHLLRGSIYYIASSFKSYTRGVLKCCGPVACKPNICVCAPLTLGAGISVDYASALQALWYKMYRIRQSLLYLYNFSAGHYQCYDEFKTIWPSNSNFHRN